MGDLLYIFITVGFFGLAIMYLDFCDWLKPMGGTDES